MPLYRPAEEVVIFEWLNNEVEEGTVVLSSFETGNAMPAWAPITVVIGHGPETANNRLLRSQVQAFYSGQMKQDQQNTFLTTHQVKYVFYGPKEREFGEMEFLKATNYELRMMLGEYQLFEVAIRDSYE